LQLPYIVAGQQFEVVFKLSAAAKSIEKPMKRSIIQFDIRYKSNTDEEIFISENLDLWLVPLTDAVKPSSDSTVLASYYRRKAALCLLEVMNKACEGKVKSSREALKACLEEIKEGEGKRDLEWTGKTVDKEIWTWKDWARVISLAGRYYYGMKDVEWIEDKDESIGNPAVRPMETPHIPAISPMVNPQIPTKLPLPDIKMSDKTENSPITRISPKQERPISATFTTPKGIEERNALPSPAAPAQLPASNTLDSTKPIKLKRRRLPNAPLLQRKPDNSMKRKKIAK
jgi:hypothetical protein